MNWQSSKKYIKIWTKMLVLLNDGILYFLPCELRPRAKLETPGVEGVKKDPEQGGDKSSEI